MDDDFNFDDDFGNESFDDEDDNFEDDREED